MSEGLNEFDSNTLSGSFDDSDASTDGDRHDLSFNDQETAEQTRTEALQLFEQCDFVMEPKVLPTLSRYFRAGGSPEIAKESLVNNYQGFAQMCNVMGEWLLQLDEDGPESVQEIFEHTLTSLILKHFEPKKADRIFDQNMEGTSGIDWLPELIAHTPWRSLVYSLAEDYPDCLMINFAVKLISDAGFQHEISNVTTAAQQLEIFSRVLCTSIEAVLCQHRKGPGTDSYEKALAELIHVACHSEHTYLYTQTLLHLFSHQDQDFNDAISAEASAACKHLEQCLQQALQQDTTAVSLALLKATTTSNTYPPDVIRALQSMLSKRCLNPADMTKLYDYYILPNAPPVEALRDPLFLNMIIDALFKPKGIKIHTEHRHKYIYLLAYSSSVAETIKDGKKTTSRVELDITCDNLDRISCLCQERSSGEDIIQHLMLLFNSLKFSSVAAGMFHWIACTVTEPDYFKLHPEPVPIHLALLDEISSNHLLMHNKVFQLLTSLFAKEFASEGVVGELLMERQRTFIDRLVHLLSIGFALPVTEFIAGIFKDGQTDVSLIRYFAIETLEIVSPPYSQDFIDVFLPLIENCEIFDSSVHEKVSAAREFIEHCTSFNIA